MRISSVLDNLFHFFRKSKKVWIAVGMLIVYISIVLWNGEGDRTQQDQASKPEVESVQKPMPKSQSESVENTETEETQSAKESGGQLTSEYELLYEGITLFDVFEYAAFQNTAAHAKLYMRRLRESAEEYVELSLWEDQREIWHTISNAVIEDEEQFWRKHSECLTQQQKMCYYVVTVDGAAYLMRYCVEISANAATMSYKVFGIDALTSYSSQGSEEPYDVGSVSVYLVSDGFVAPEVSFPISQMIAFADTVRGYMENGYQAVSTLQGVFETDGSSDRDNPFFPYLYDIFPWIPELAVKCGVNTEAIKSAEELLTALQKSLPTDAAITMPDVAADGSYFVTGDYYSDNDGSSLTVRRKKEGGYIGHLLIDNTLNMNFKGEFDAGILLAEQTDSYADDIPYTIKVFFQNGRAAVEILTTPEEAFVKTGETFVLDRAALPMELKIMRNAELRREE